MTYAVLKSGGKQYKAQKDAIINVEKIEGKAGDTVELDATIIGSSVKAGKVKAEIVEQDRHDKVTIYKKKRRQGYRRTKGHKQPFTKLKIVEAK